MLREISKFYDARLADNSPALVTFTYVKLTDDLRQATVYYSCLGDEHNQASVASYLQKEQKTIRKAIGKSIRTRHNPELAFKFDPSIADGIRIEKLLDEIKDKSEK